MIFVSTFIFAELLLTRDCMIFFTVSLLSIIVEFVLTLDYMIYSGGLSVLLCGRWLR